MHKTVITFLLYTLAFFATAAVIKSLHLPEIILIVIAAGLLMFDGGFASFDSDKTIVNTCTWLINGMAYAALYICLSTITGNTFVIFLGLITMLLARNVAIRTTKGQVKS